MNEPGAEALDLLEWPRLAGHLAGFASTAAGGRHCAALPLPAHPADSRRLLAETTELLGLDGVLEGGLSFRGVADIAATVNRCAKGARAGGLELLDLATPLAAARRLRRHIDDGALRPVTSALVADLRTLPELEQRLHFAIEEGGRVADRASPELAALRRQLQGVGAPRRGPAQGASPRRGPPRPAHPGG
ncbi:MAG: endonuclease MutS2, partial [Cyanobacteriota bacterium]